MLLNSGNDNISDMIGTALKSLITASEYDDVLKECCDTLSDAEGLIRDAGHSISSYIENSEYDPREFSELQERLDLINNLKNKYGSSIEAINDTLKAVNAKLADYYNFDELTSRRKKGYVEPGFIVVDRDVRSCKCFKCKKSMKKHAVRRGI